MKNTELTPKMQQILDLVTKRGGMFAGHDVDDRGWQINVPASTLRALEKRGLITLSISPDGGMMALPVKVD